MTYHVTQRCALIRMCREVKPLLCYGQERCSEVFLTRPVFVIYVCMHSSFKACRLLTTSASRHRSVHKVSSPCARSSVDGPQRPLLDGIGECSPPLAVLFVL